MEHIISKINPDSIAEELELEVGDVLLKINDKEIEDVFDYRYLMNDEYVELLIRKKNGEEWLLEVDKEYDEELGAEFESGLMSDYKSCHNKCIFCFIDQMPPGMRETLYFKDDDSRLSFLQGNYITLTNMKEADIDRIIKLHLSPINISIQSMNPEVRCKMLNNRFAGDALRHLKTLYENEVPMNGQIVLCKGVNDGEELEYSLREMYKLAPVMQSVSIVPAGLSKFREGLYPLEPFTKEESQQVIDQIETWQKKAYNEYGIHFVHASDEWYIQADREFPEVDRYDGYIQLENGVGMMRLLYTEVTDYLDGTKDTDGIEGDDRVVNISIATGVLAYPMIRQLCDKITDKFPNIHVNVYKIINNFFGESITVSGLITGQDLMAQLKSKDLGDRLLLPSNILRSGEDVFLDDMHLGELETTLQTSVNIVESSGADFVEAIINGGGIKTRTDNGFNYIEWR